MQNITDGRMGNISSEQLTAYFNISKKVIQEYVAEIERHSRYKSFKSRTDVGVILDDRSRLIDLYDSCMIQDAHLGSVCETLYSQILGERYMLASKGKDGKFVRDEKNTSKIQGTQFIKMIKGIIDARLYGYSLIEIMNLVDEKTGRLGEVNIVERRNVLCDQGLVLKEQGRFERHWDITKFPYNQNYVLVKSDDIGIFAKTTPLVLARRFIWANFINFTHTYGQPIIHGKSGANEIEAKRTLASDIANSANNRVLVTGLDDEIDIKQATQANSERIFLGAMEHVDTLISNLIVGATSMAGETQSYVGSTSAHQDIFRDRVEVYREFVENVMNEEIIPRLVELGFIDNGLYFKYSNKLEMSNKDKIELYKALLKSYDIPPEEIDREFGVVVNMPKPKDTSKVNFQTGQKS
ncbi:MAG: phage portal protein family protein [Bacteroidales bacterium]